MEMHQVRYFLAVCEELNFTRAAEKCHVAQPSLTRAIKQLEGELGGDLFRRERPRAILTPLGERIYPRLRQCYDSALSARELAGKFSDRQAAVLNLAMSNSIELGPFLRHVGALASSFGDVDLKIVRGSGPQALEALKAGQAELAVAATIDDAWDRLDRWTLFEEPYELVLGRAHRLAGRDSVAAEDLAGERCLARGHCEQANALDSSLTARGLGTRKHEVGSDADMVALAEAEMGIGLLPASVPSSDGVTRATLAWLDVRRTVCVYAVAGRQRSVAAATFLKMLRAAKWR